MDNYGRDRPPDMTSDDRHNPGPQTVGGGFQSQPQSQQPPNIQQLMSNVPQPTFEDKMLIKAVNKECFWYRFVPLSLIGCASYYYYNEQKAKPQRIVKYAGLALAAYIFSKLSYYKILQQRLVESPSNSQFVMYIRRNSGFNNTNMYNHYQNYGSSTASGFEDPTKNEKSGSEWMDPVVSEFVPETPTTQDPNNPAFPGPGFTSLSYDELRARNRENYEKNNNKKF